MCELGIVAKKAFQSCWVLSMEANVLEAQQNEKQAHKRKILTCTQTHTQLQTHTNTHRLTALTEVARATAHAASDSNKHDEGLIMVACVSRLALLCFALLCLDG